MFIQTDSTKRMFHENSSVPDFKPISDAQIKKINEIIKELTSANKVQIISTKDKRKGRVLDNDAESSNLDVIEIKKDERLETSCPQGGTCEFFFYCWMVGGLLDGSCGSLLKGCCHRVAKAGILGVQDSNSIEYSSIEGHSFGPVLNDESK